MAVGCPLSTRGVGLRLVPGSLTVGPVFLVCARCGQAQLVATGFVAVALYGCSRSFSESLGSLSWLCFL